MNKIRNTKVIKATYSQSHCSPIRQQTLSNQKRNTQPSFRQLSKIFLFPDAHLGIVPMHITTIPRCASRITPDAHLRIKSLKQLSKKIGRKYRKGRHNLPPLTTPTKQEHKEKEHKQTVDSIKMITFAKLYKKQYAVGKFDAYKIPLKSLEDGAHSFTVRLDRKFFSDIDGEEVQKGELDVRIEVKKGTYSFDFAFSIAGRVWVPCDRCLDDVEVAIETEEKLVVKYGADFSEEGESTIIIPEEEDEINMAWYLYEFVALAIPLKHVHAPGKCNKSMTSKLKKHSARSADDDGEEGFELDETDSIETEMGQDSVDPRWEGLKNLID